LSQRGPRGETLRAHLLWRLLPTVTVLIVVTTWFAYTLALSLARNAYDAALFDSARSLAQQIRTESDSTPTLTLPRAAEEILVSDPFDRIYYRVVDAHGNTIAGDARVPLPETALTEAQAVSFYDAQIAGERIRASAYAVFRDGNVPIGTVVFAETLVKRNRLSHELLLTLVVPVVVLTFFVGALVWYGVRSGVAPLDTLVDSISRRSWGDLRPMAAAGVPGEVRPLVASMNNLIERLDAAQSAQQRFISEAAHQLRTPLAGLTSQIERALLARDMDGVNAALTQVQGSSRRVIRLVNQLLTLAKAEPGGDPRRELAPIDLSTIVQETCREWVPDALSKGVDLGFIGTTDPVPILGHEHLIAEMLNNLIDNALRYGAAPGSSVTVRLTAAPHVELAVEDEGPGIPAHERQRVFERFHRLPGAAAGGCGLGLAIVREIARFHGAEVSVDERATGSGAVFRIVFSGQPAAPEAGTQRSS
jgi:two-component system sensor histidine kinase TctE